MRYLRNDWALYVAALGLCLVGAVLIWSATHARVGPALSVRQLIATALGLAAALALVRLDLRWVRAAAPWIYLAGVAGLALVLTPLGVTVNGARSWLHAPGGFSVQPVELSKLALVVGLAMVLAEGRGPTRLPGGREVLLGWTLAAVPIGLVMLQPDLGSALVLAAMTTGMVAASGAAWWWTVGAVVSGTALATAAVTVPLLSSHQVSRLLAFADPSLDPEGIGYQTRQARLAIGSGGWDGAGLGQGPQTQGGFIPFQETDFIFSVAGEELGFVGAAGLVALLAFVVLRALWVAARAQDIFARLVAVGIACWLGGQTLENVGMNLGLLPVTGLPLPFVSYGGSSVLACWLAVGLLSSAELLDRR